MKALIAFFITIVSFSVSANMAWVDTFNRFNSAESKKAQTIYATEEYSKLLMRRGFRKSIITDFNYRRFNVGEKYGLVLLEDIKTSNKVITQIYNQQNFKMGVLLEKEDTWKVARVFEPKNAALDILIDEPNWVLHNKPNVLKVNADTFRFQSVVAYQDPDESIWIYFYPFELDNDDLSALAWGESEVQRKLEDKASTIASTASYKKMYLHIPDIQNTHRESTLVIENLKKERDNYSFKARGKEFIQWSEIAGNKVIIKGSGFFPQLSPTVSVELKVKVPLWKRGLYSVDKK